MRSLPIFIDFKAFVSLLIYDRKLDAILHRSIASTLNLSMQNPPIANRRETKLMDVRNWQTPARIFVKEDWA